MTSSFSIETILRAEAEIVMLLDIEFNSLLDESAIKTIFDFFKSINLNVIPVPRYLEEVYKLISTLKLGEDFQDNFLLTMLIELRIRLKLLLARYSAEPCSAEKFFKEMIISSFDIWRIDSEYVQITPAEMCEQSLYVGETLINAVECEPWLFSLLIAIFYFEKTDKYKSIVSFIKK